MLLNRHTLDDPSKLFLQKSLDEMLIFPESIAVALYIQNFLDTFKIIEINHGKSSIEILIINFLTSFPEPTATPQPSQLSPKFSPP